MEYPLIIQWALSYLPHLHGYSLIILIIFIVFHQILNGIKNTLTHTVLSSYPLQTAMWSQWFFMFVFIKHQIICPALNTWVGRSYFQEECFQKQQDLKGSAAVWWGKQEFLCYLDSQNRKGPFPFLKLQKHGQPCCPHLLQLKERKPSYKTKWRLNLAVNPFGKRWVENQRTGFCFPLIRTMWLQISYVFISLS